MPDIRLIPSSNDTFIAEAISSEGRIALCGAQSKAVWNIEDFLVSLPQHINLVFTPLH